MAWFGRSMVVLGVTGLTFMASTCVSVAAGLPAASVRPAAGNGWVTWKTGADVVAGLKSKGFTCRKDGSVPKAEPAYDAVGKRTRAMLIVQCDGFAVVLVRDRKKTAAIEKAICASSTAADWDRMQLTTGLTGKNFYVVTYAEDHRFPANKQPADFQRAFGGVVETDAQYLTRVHGCHRP